MIQEEYVNLGEKKKEFDSKVLNIESIFTKIEYVLNISKFRNELNNIKEKIEYDKTIDNYNICIQELNDLDKKINDVVLPFYEMYLLISKIEKGLDNIIEEDIDEIIKNTKKLIDTIISIGSYENRDVGYLFTKSYKIIYKLIIYEEIFDRCDILQYINQLDVEYIKENIGKLLMDDVNRLNQNDDKDDVFNNLIVEEELKNINKEGLGYDYLNLDFIKKISKMLISKKYIEYDAKKNGDILRMSSKINNFTKKNDYLTSSLNDNNEEMKRNYINISLLITKALSLILVPVIMFSLGRGIGKKSSSKITEYSTITRTIDLDTKEIIGDIEYVYDEVETTYVATIMECSPWRQNPAGIGYIRNITAYECVVPDEIGEDYHITKDDLENNLLKKYSYIETKETLTKDDNTTQTTILLTETYQDKNDTRKSTKYIIPFSILGGGLGIGIDLLLVFLGLYDLDEIRMRFNKLDRDIKRCKLNNQEIREELINMTEQGNILEEEYSGLVKRYGEFKIDETVHLQDKSTPNVRLAKTRVRRKY